MSEQVFELLIEALEALVGLSLPRLLIVSLAITGSVRIRSILEEVLELVLLRLQKLCLLRHVECLLTVLGHLQPERLLIIGLRIAHEHAGLGCVASGHGKSGRHSSHLLLVLLLAHGCLLRGSRRMRR